MFKTGLRTLNRCASSRRALSNYNNNNTSCCPNATFNPSLATSYCSSTNPCFTCKSSKSNKTSNRYFTSSSPSSIRSPSPCLSHQQHEQQQLIQSHHKYMELHMEIRLSLIELINEFASHDLPNMSLNDMLKFKDFTPENELFNTQSLIENANTTLYTLLVLNCKRLREFKKLPYICVVNPNIANIFNSYVTSLEKLMNFINENSIDKTVNTLEDEIINYYKNFQILDLETNDEFLQILTEILDIHTDNLPILSEGFKEISQYSLIDDDQFFLNNHLKERIMLRLSIKHHLLLSRHFKEYSQKTATLAEINNIGMIDKDLDVIDLIKQVSEFVNDMSSLKYDERISINFETMIIDSTSTKTENFSLDGSSMNIQPLMEKPNTKSSSSQIQIIFPYIASHLKYVLQELLKNSTRAQIENNIKKPIQITIVLNKSSPQSYLELRIRDQGKGISRNSLDNLFDYSFTTVTKAGKDNENDNYDVFNNGTGTDANIIAGMGYGLPLSKLYVEMFGGDLELQSYEGWGTDVYIKLQGPESKLLD